MSVTGLCQICERQEAKYGCDRCGTLVCAEHFDRERLLCTNCAAQTRPDDRRHDPDREFR